MLRKVSSLVFAFIILSALGQIKWNHITLEEYYHQLMTSDFFQGLIGRAHDPHGTFEHVKEQATALKEMVKDVDFKKAQENYKKQMQLLESLKKEQ